MSQTDLLLEYFRTGKSLTVAEALNELGIYALSQRVGDLKRMGYNIKSETVEHNGKHFSRYWMEVKYEQLELVPSRVNAEGLGTPSERPSATR